jgi:hypothetical protein
MEDTENNTDATWFWSKFRVTASEYYGENEGI